MSFNRQRVNHLCRVFAVVAGLAFAPALAAAQPQTAFDVTVSRASVAMGEPVVLGVTVLTPGGQPTADALMIAVGPGGQTVLSITPGGLVPGQLSNLRSIVPVVRGVNLAAPLRYVDPRFFTFTRTDSPGTYTVYFALLTSGALNDGVLGGGEVLALDVATFSVRPPVLTTVDASRSTSGNFGAAGGTLAATAANGTALSLAFAPGALATATPVAMAPLASATNLPPGMTFVGGVRAAPSGARFDAPVTLAVTLPLGTTPAPRGYVGVLTRDDGTGVEIVPARLTGTTITFAAPHFSDLFAVELQNVSALCADPTSPQMAEYCPVIEAAYALATDIDDLRASVRPYLQGWLEEGIMPRATLAETDAAGADQAIEVNYLDLFPFVTIYDSLYGDAWYGPPSRPFAAQLDTVHAQMTFGTDYYEQRRNAACLQNKTTAASQISSVSNINALYVTLFSLDRDPTYCARVDIEAVVLAVPSGATPGNVLTSIAVRFTDGVVAPGVSVVATVTATNGSASPAGGIVPTPITGPITVVLNPGQTSMQLTITAVATDLGLPLVTRVVPVAGTSGGTVTFTGGSLRVIASATASNFPLTNGQSFDQRVDTAAVGAQALSSGALSGQLNILTMPNATASGQASRAAVQTNPQAMQLIGSGSTSGRGQVSAGVANSGQAQAFASVEDASCVRLAQPTTVNFTISPGVRITHFSSILANGATQGGGTLLAPAGEVCVLAGVGDSVTVTAVQPGTRQFGVSYTYSVTFGVP